MFKSFSEKSKAKRGLLAFAAKQGVELSAERVTDLLQMHGDPMKWGFHEQDVTDKDVRESFAGAGIGTEVQPLEGAALNARLNNLNETNGESIEEEEPAGPVAAPNMFSGIASTLGAVASTPAASATRAPAASRSAYTIEKDRPEQNGIKRPSAGGLCRAVWDAMDEQRTTNGGETPTTQQVRDLALMHNWNVNNAMIEYYQWRKFNGITGRAKKAEAALATV